MASIAAGTGQFLSLHQTRSRSKLPSPSSSASITTATIRCEQILSQNPKKLTKTRPSKTPLFSVKNLAISAASGILFHVAFKNPSLIGIGGGNGGGGAGGGGGGDGGGGGGGGGFWKRLLSPAANADENQSSEWDSHGLPADIIVQLNKLSGFKKYKVSELVFVDKQSTTVVGSEDSFFEMVSLRAGGVYTKAQLQKELETLATCGMFEKVDLEAKTNPDGTIGLTVSFTESTWEEAEHFRCINVGLMQQSKGVDAEDNMTEKEKVDYMRNQEKDYRRRMDKARPCMLPSSVNREIKRMLGQGPVSARMLQSIRDRVQKWYHDEGYACAQVVNFGNLNTEEVVCEVVEGDITRVVIQFQDKLGNVCEGNTQPGVVKRELPKQLQKGYIFNIEAGKQALRNINSLSLFSNIEVNPRPDEKNEGGIIVEIKLKELEQKSAEVSTEWSIVPGRGGRPTLASIQPGGTVSFEHRNIKGLNRSLLGSVTTSNFLNPQMVYLILETALCVQAASTAESSVQSSQVDQEWTKFLLYGLIEPNFTRQSKFTYGIVMEEITTRDESSHISSNGQRVLPSGGISADGPPTTLSGTGIDRMVFAQANITRDNTKFVNGAIVGERNVFQLAAEVRVPVRNTHVYLFAEHGNDLGSSKDVKGNPTEVYRRMGHGSSYGVGAKLGLVRAEYAIDHNSGTGALFFRFGERF
ncbi:Bacterial surface antigen (D15) [Cynara cardunculus var. scolymus]|uniref:Bacterial surface antigen (D15) n=1 Tax=Cynara cardunculus var. scolymus TaxID=59895 RepID=A0A103Y6W1_CYNCS|nr:Bacterial surface antigen (D15) [Cynara cardunculus var. scolymus]